MLGRRISLFQPDILEWMSGQRKALQIIRQNRYNLEKGFVAYFNDFVDLFNQKSAETDKNALAEQKKQSAEGVEEKKPIDTMAQYYESEELIKRMKWKRVTWNEDADYFGFSRRILDNDSMFKNAPAFSFMSLHLIKDPLTNNLVNTPTPEKTINSMDLTRWFLQERTVSDIPLYPTSLTKKRRSAFSVDWVTGEVWIVDTASAQEILSFLTTVAPRLQALQIKMEKQQARQKEDVENVRVRVGATLKFNEFDTSYWDDPKRRENSKYVNPDEVEKCLQGLLKSAFLYRWFLKGQQIRIVRTGNPYFADYESSEIHIPANFAEYNWLHAHSRFERLERIFNSFRRY